jgi:hypothetical protein
MKTYFGTQITPLLTFTVEPIDFTADDPDTPAEGIAISFTWQDIDGFAQYHGYGSWQGQPDLITKIDAILRDQMPWYIEGSLYDSLVDETGEHWLIPLPTYKRITADYIDVV